MRGTLQVPLFYRTTIPLRAVELALKIEGRRDVTGQLYRALRDVLLNGRVQAGDKLPSSRELAWRLAVSRNTVHGVYERLISEGFLTAHHGSGTFVSAHRQNGLDAVRAHPLPVVPKMSGWATRLNRSRFIVPQRDLPYDFRPGLTDLGSFPIDVWRRLAATNLRTLTNRIALYGDASGHVELRLMIARYLSHSRAVVCGADDVMVTSGMQQGLDLLGRVLIEPGDMVAVENPCYTAAVSVFRALGAEICPVDVDADGLRVDQLPARAKLVYVTPSHQFPMGVTMSLPRRIALLAWAREVGACVIEDDYDSEFRFSGRPLESLQGLDRSGVVVYLGTFSKVLFPGLRLGYVVVPRALKETLVAAKWTADRHSSSLEQCIMADFMAQGHFRSYLRRMQHLYAHRREALIDGLNQWTAPHLRLLAAHAGLHTTGLLRSGFDTDELTRRAFETGVGLYSIESFFLRRPKAGLMFGFGGCTIADIREGARRLGGIFGSLSHGGQAP